MDLLYDIYFFYSVLDQHLFVSTQFLREQKPSGVWVLLIVRLYVDIVNFAFLLSYLCCLIDSTIFLSELLTRVIFYSILKQNVH